MSSESRIKIYTKTGDKGFTSLFSGERRSKADDVFEALGSNDELTSAVGLAISQSPAELHDLVSKLKKIQCCLQDINANLATPKSSSPDHKLQRVAFDDNGKLVEELEQWIDSMEAVLPPLRNFILPSGGLPSSTLHLCRTICRRAERRVVPLVQDNQCDASCGKYLNRLGDFLFVAARFSCHTLGFQEDIYKKQ